MFKLALLSVAAMAGMLGVTGSLKNGNLQPLKRDTRVIVELDKNVNYNTALNYIRGTVTDNFFVTDRFSTMMNGMIMNVNSSYVDSLKELSFVKTVQVDKFHKVSEAALTSTPAHSESDNASAETMEKPQGTNEGAGVAIAIFDTGAYLGHNTFTALDSSVAVKYTKEGIQDLIKGTSFHGKPDATHSTYWNNKVPFYYDYGGEIHSEEELLNLKEDYDVYNAVEEHGNHVASLAAGNDPAYKGIAPNAQILVMKVFTEDFTDPTNPSTGAYDSSILKALEDAEILGVDIVNMSLGSDLDDFSNDNLGYRKIRELQNKGMFFSISAGNAGKTMYERSGAVANWTTDMTETGIMGSYANIPEAMTVASSVPTFKFYETALIVGSSVVSYEDQITDYTTSDGEVKYDPNRYLTDITKGGKINFDWVRVPGWGEAELYDKLNVQGKIAVVDRGETTFVQKITAAQNNGAVACMIINNDPTETDFTFRMDLSGWTPDIPVVTLLYRDRILFTSAKAGDPSVPAETGTLKLVTKEFADCPDVDMISTFSTDGGTYTGDLKPEIAAPGDEVKGAVYLPSEGTTPLKDKYEYYSGTSMAAPNLAGAMAIALGEHLNDTDYRKSLNARMMSGAKPGLAKNGLVDSPFTSPRLQGAGIASIDNTLRSKVYLTGTKALTEEDTDKAKICLYNTDKISSGRVDLSFYAHNDSDNPITYEATTFIYRPDLVELDSENYPEFAGVKFQSVIDHQIGEHTETITVNPGKSLIELEEFVISDADKDEIDRYFTNSCPIEGYVILRPSDISEPDLTIPFLGYYGDYDKEAPVEPFDFEKDPNVTYPSDLVNNFANDVMGYPKANFSSMIAVGQIDDMEKFSMDSWILNENNLYEMKGFCPIGTNPATGEVEPDKLFLGNNGVRNAMVIQQFVTRSVTTNKITLTNTDSGKVVLNDHMFDSLFGSEGNWQLFKSHVCVDYVAMGVFAHRAYSIIPMYNPDTKELYPDGKYEMKMEYTLASGGTYTKTINFVLDSEAPEYRSLKETEDSYQLYVSDEALSYGTINGARASVKKDEDGYTYFEISKSDVTDKIVLNAYDYAGAVTKLYIDITSKDFFTVEHSSMAMNVTSTLTKSVSADGSEITYSYSLTQKNKPLTVTGATFYLNVGDYSLSQIKLLEVKDGKETEISILAYDNGVIKFKSDATTFKLVISGAPVPGPTSSSSSQGPAPKGGCGGSVIASSAIVSTVALLGVGILIIAKKKKSQ